MTQRSPKAHRGPFAAGDQVQLTDPKGRMHQIVLQPGGTFHTHRGSLKHDDLIGAPEGSVITATSGTAYVALRPLLADYTLAMKRGATIVYPKDAAQILAYADVFPGARVLEAGAGSGALSCWLLRAIGPEGQLVSFEARADFAEIARANVTRFYGEVPPQWRLETGRLDVAAAGEPASFDRVILDMLAPWECLPDADRSPVTSRHQPGVSPKYLSTFAAAIAAKSGRRSNDTSSPDGPAARSSQQDSAPEPAPASSTRAPGKMSA